MLHVTWALIQEVRDRYTTSQIMETLAVTWNISAIIIGIIYLINIMID